MRTVIIISFKLLLVMTILTGVLYTLLVTIIATSVFPNKAHGSIAYRNEQPVGSYLIAQEFSNARYFWPRDSVKGYETIPSSATNLSPASKNFLNCVEHRKSILPPNIGQDMLTRSASGLDPDISPASAYAQVERVSDARAINAKEMTVLITKATKPRKFFLLGEPRVNVLELNIKLDQLSNVKSNNEHRK